MPDEKQGACINNGKLPLLLLSGIYKTVPGIIKQCFKDLLFNMQMNIQVIAASRTRAPRWHRAANVEVPWRRMHAAAGNDKNNTSVLLCGIVKLHPLQPPHTLSKTNKEET